MIEYKVIEKLAEAKKAMEAFSDVFGQLSPINDMVMNLLTDGAGSDIRGAEIALDSLPGSMDDVKALPGEQRLEVMDMEQAYAARDNTAWEAIHDHGQTLDDALNAGDTETIKEYLSVGFGVERIAEHTAFINPNPEIAKILMADYGENMLEDSSRASLLFDQADNFSADVRGAKNGI